MVVVSSGQLKLGYVDTKCYINLQLLSWKAYNLRKWINNWRGMWKKGDKGGNVRKYI